MFRKVYIGFMLLILITSLRMMFTIDPLFGGLIALMSFIAGGIALVSE